MYYESCRDCIIFSYLSFALAQSYINNYLDSLSKIDFPGKYRLDFNNIKALVGLHCLQAERAESPGDRIKMLHQVVSF